MDCKPSSSDKKTLKRWFFIDKRAGWSRSPRLIYCWHRFKIILLSKSTLFKVIICATNLDPMDLKSNHTAPVLTDPAPLSNTRLGVHSSLFPYSPSGAAFTPGLLLTIPRKKTGVLDDVRSCSWLDAMKASSPPHRKIIKDVNEFAPSDADVAYRTWTVLFIAVCMIWSFVQYWFFFSSFAYVFYSVVLNFLVPI